MKKVFYIFIILSIIPLLVSCHEEKMHEDKSETSRIKIFEGKLFIRGVHYDNIPYQDFKDVSYTENITYDAIDGQRTMKLYGIFENAFYNHRDIEEISFENSVESEFTIIMQRGFQLCVKLHKINIPDSVQIIEQNAFNTCLSLPKIEMLGLVTLGDTAFAGCSSLKSIVIGDKIESIGSYAFLYCHNDLELTILASTPPVIGLEILKGVENYTIKVPNDAVAAYRNDSAWSVYGERIIGIESKLNNME